MRWLLRLALVVAAVLLVSFGGAIVAAPVTIPILAVTIRARDVERPTRLVGAVVLALTVGELVWALTYITLGEVQPLIWLAPGAAALASGAVALSSVLKSSSRTLPVTAGPVRPPSD